MTPRKTRMNPGGRSITPLLVMSFFLILSWNPAASAGEEPGKQLFLDNKCNMCHSIEALEIERTSSSDKLKAVDLSTVGDDLDLEWAVKFLMKEIEREGALHKKTFKGTKDDATTIANWLMTLKTPA